MKIFGREPAQWLQLASGLLVMLTPFIPSLTDDLKVAIMAVLTALFGFLTAAVVSAEKAAPFVAGLVKAMLVLGMALGLKLNVETIGGVMTFVEAAVAWYLRTQVVAPVSAGRADSTVSPSA